MIVRVIHEAGSCLFDAQVQNMKTVILEPQNILNTVVFSLCEFSCVLSLHTFPVDGEHKM